MDARKLEEQMEELATEINKAIGRFLEETEFVIEPLIKIEYLDTNRIGARQFAPMVNVSGFISTTV